MAAAVSQRLRSARPPPSSLVSAVPPGAARRVVRLRGTAGRGGRAARLVVRARGGHGLGLLHGPELGRRQVADLGHLERDVEGRGADAREPHDQLVILDLAQEPALARVLAVDHGDRVPEGVRRDDIVVPLHLAVDVDREHRPRLVF